MLRLFLLGKSIAKSTGRKEVSTFSASAAFFIMLASIPFILFLISLIESTILKNNEYETMLLNFVPELFLPMAQALLDDIRETSSHTILSLFALTTLYASSKGVYAIVRGLNFLHNVVDNRNYVIRKSISIFYTFILTLMIFLSLVLLVLANTIGGFIERTLPKIAFYVRLVLDMRHIGMSIILFVFFLFMYVTLPNKKLSFKSQLPGAVFTTTGWILFSKVFSYYVEHFANYSKIYGSMSILIIVMLWAYALMYILFLGAMINIHIADPLLYLTPDQKKKEHTQKSE